MLNFRVEQAPPCAQLRAPHERAPYAAPFYRPCRRVARAERSLARTCGLFPTGRMAVVLDMRRKGKLALLVAAMQNNMVRLAPAASAHTNARSDAPSRSCRRSCLLRSSATPSARCA